MHTQPKNKQGGHSPAISSLSQEMERLRIFPHSSPSLSYTVKGGFVGLCILLPGQSQVDTPLPSSLSQFTRCCYVVQTRSRGRRPDRLPIILPQGVNQHGPDSVLLCAAVMTDLREGNLFVNLACVSHPSSALKLKYNKLTCCI